MMSMALSAARMGELLRVRFEAIAQRHEHLGVIRGLGLLWGLEFITDPASKTPDAALCRRITEQAYQRGLCMIAPIGMFGNVLRVAPPLVITEQQAHESLDIFEAAIEAALQQ